MILLTDHPWQGTEVEAAVFAAAGHELVDADPGDDPAALAALAASGGAEAIVTNWATVTAELMDASPRLRVVARLGVGVDNIDVGAARARGIVVTRVPDYCVEEVSDHAVAMLLAWARGLWRFDRSVQAGRFEPGMIELRRVRNLVVGVWGTGRNGLATAAKMAALGCRVLVDDHHAGLHGPFEQVCVDELLGRADVVSVHLPLTPATRGLIDAGVLATMRPGSLLVNTGRGALLDVDALVAALDRGTPGAAALDVVPTEPHVPPALLARPDVLVTPHVAFSSKESIAEVRRRTAEDVVRVLRGEPPLDPYLG